MNVDREKIWAAGQRFLQRGQADKAIAEFERIVAEDPDDLRAPLKIGDLELQRGNVEGARRNFLRVVDAYMAQGFWSKAAALLKQLAHVDAGDLHVQALLAEVYEKQGLVAESNQQWLLLAQIHDQAGRAEEAKTALRHIEQIEPSDVELALAWAQVAGRLDMGAEVLPKLSAMAETLHKEKRERPWALVGAQILEFDPSRVALACELARYYLAESQPGEALTCLRLAFRANPQDQDVMQLLAEAFEALGQRDKALAVWVELAAQTRRRGQVRSLERMLGHVLRLAPDNAEAKAEWDRLVAAHGGGAPMARQPAKKAAPSLQERPVTAGDISSLLIEARVFHRYRLTGRARDYLGRILQAFPDHQETRALDDTYRQEQEERRKRRAAVGEAAAAQRVPETTMPSLSLNDMNAAVEEAQPEERPSFEQPAHKAAEAPLPRTILLPSDNTQAPQGAPSLHAAPSRTVASFDLDLGAEEDAPKSPPPKAILNSSLSSTEAGLDVDALDALIAAAAPEPEAAQHRVTHALEALSADGPREEDKFAQTLQMGVAYCDMDLLADAIAQFDLVKAYAPLAAEAWLRAAQCLDKQGDKQAARHHFEQGLVVPSATPEQKEALYDAFSTFLRREGDSDLAEQQAKLAEDLKAARAPAAL